MARRQKKKDCLIVLLNVGAENDPENETSFLEQSKFVTKLLIQKKIFLRPKDEVGVVIMGASETRNRLSFENIVEMNSLQIPNWDLIENITRLRETAENANWVEGINVVLNYINAECVEQSTTRTIVLLTDFNEDSDVIEQYNMKTIAADIQAADVNLLAVGNKLLNGDSQTDLNSSEKLFSNLCKMVCGEIMTFDDAIPKLMIYKDQEKTPIPWKVDMDLFDIDIPIMMYLKTTEDFQLPKWKLYTDTETGRAPVERNRALVDKNKQEISQDEIITGNMYGRKFIAFSDEDKAALKYESGPKGLMVHGFTKRKFITMDCLAGKGSYIVVPAQQFATPFYSLIKAMVNQNKVAIVRRVYRANCAPKMGVLFPKIDPGHPWCLVYIELTFAEDRRIVQVKPLKSTMNDLSEEQEKAVDSLIDAMMLTNVEDDSTKENKEVFKAGTVPDISRQCVWDRLTERALNPNSYSPLPPMSEFLNKILEPPKSLKGKSKPILRSIQKLFPVKPVVNKKFVIKTIADLQKDPDKSYKDLEESMEDDPNDLSMQKENPEIVASKDAASQAMNIDLEELVKDM